MSKIPSVVLEEVVTKQVALLSVAQKSIRDIAKELGVSEHQVRKIQASSAFADVVKTIGEDTLAVAKQHIKAEMSGMAKDVVRVLKQHLQEGNLDAVKVVLKTMGFDNEQQQTGDTNIQVILPGQGNEKAVQSEVIDDAIQDN